MKIRLASSIVITPDEGQIVIWNLSTNTRRAISQPVLRLLSELTRWRDKEEVVNSYPGELTGQVGQAIESLVAEKFVITDGSATADTSEGNTWTSWGQVARIFHLGTRDANYLSDPDEKRQLADELTANPGPSIFKTYPNAPRIYLPRKISDLAINLGDALRSRRTHRDFEDQPVSIDTLSTILQYTFGPQIFADAGPFGIQMFKTSPCAGSRHETECYLAAFNVDGLPPGVYHYNVECHALELIRDELSRETVADLTYRQRACSSSAFTCFVSAVLERLSYKYQHPRAYRLWMYDVGHLGQTFALVATALGLGPFQTAAFQDTQLEAFLGIDGSAEIATYVLGAGVAKRHADGTPIAYNFPQPSIWPHHSSVIIK